ncbi:MAG: hypothetical protein WC124_07025, partial [Desulfoplanes sp.]
IKLNLSQILHPSRSFVPFAVKKELNSDNLFENYGSETGFGLTTFLSIPHLKKIPCLFTSCPLDVHIRPGRSRTSPHKPSIYTPYPLSIISCF